MIGILNPGSPFPPGYALTVVSWENDADNYNSVNLFGLSEADVHFYLAILEQFRGTYWGGKLGNQDIEEGQEILAIEKAFQESPPDSPELVREFQEILTKCREGPDVMYDLIGIWMQGERWRVFDSFQVHYIPKECPNVTQKFPLP